MAKALALGASLTSISKPVLEAAVKGVKETKQELLLLIEELKNSMFLVGADTVQALKEKPVVITGKTAEWLRLRGFNIEVYAKRGK